MRSQIPTFAPVFGDEERQAIQKHIATDPYLTSGKSVEKFQRDFSKHINRHYGVMVNSGSSALQVAILAMGWKRGDKILIPACNFPTAISPLIWFGLVPVFVDCNLETFNTDPQRVKDAINAVGGISGGVVLHNLGNPLDPEIWPLLGASVEDASDALGSQIDGRMCGSFGEVSTHSFYAAHGICTLEGGMVVTSHYSLHDKMRSIVSWGRDCSCAPGEDDKCKNRFGYQVDGIPYDHKYIASRAGGNFKPLELQGVLGLVQLKKEPIFRETRKRNFSILYSAMREIDGLVVLPESLPNADATWFGFALTLRRGNRREIMSRIEARGVQTRMVFAGNIVRHPFMHGVECMVPFPLENSDTIMRQSIVLGCGQSMTEAEAEYVGTVVKEEIER